MDVGEGNAVGGADDLLRQMRRAHDEQVERARGTESFDEARETSASRETDAAAEAPDAGGTDAVERRVLETARRALDGEFESAEQARGEVVDTILEERYSGMVGDQDAGMERAVKDALADDVAFRSEVDNMLVHAARRLGRRDAE